MNALTAVSGTVELSFLFQCVHDISMGHLKMQIIEKKNDNNIHKRFVYHEKI